MSTQFISTDQYRTGFSRQNANNPPFPFWTESRKALGLNISQFARAVGYSNINKGRRRIEEWERTGQFPSKVIYQKCLEVLNISEEDIQKAREEYRASLGFQYQDNSEAYRFLSKHHPFLLENFDIIRRNYQLYHCVLEGVNFHAAYIGGKTIGLGNLLNVWRDGRFQTDEYYCVCGGGSPLSGNHSVSGFSKAPPHHYKRLGGVLRPKLSIHVGGLFSTGTSLWSFSQALDYLGIEVPDCIILQKGEEVGRYNYASKTLELSWQGEEVSLDCQEILPEPNEGTRVQKDARFAGWQILRQNIQYQKESILHWDQDLPPAISQYLIATVLKNFSEEGIRSW